MWNVRCFHARFGIVSFVEVQASSESDALAAGPDLAGDGFVAQFANPQHAYSLSRSQI